MNEEQAYTRKEDAKSDLNQAVREIIEACRDLDMSIEEIKQEISEEIYSASNEEISF